MARMYVRCLATDDRVVLFERHPDHPGSDVLIFNEWDRKGNLIEHAYEVEKTEKVEQALREGLLLQVSEDEAKEIEQQAAAHRQRMFAEEV